MGGYREQASGSVRRRRWPRLADAAPESAPGWEDDEPVEFEPDPELLRRIDQGQH